MYKRILEEKENTKREKEKVKEKKQNQEVQES